MDRGGSKGLAVATPGTFNAPQRRRFEEIGIKNKCLMAGWDHCYVTGILTHCNGSCNRPGRRSENVGFHATRPIIEVAMQTIRALSLNIHKGFSSGNRKFTLPALREAVRTTGADLVFLQEVLGRHDRHERRVPGWPSQPQMEYLADSVWPSFAYGRNAIYEAGHHGNAILSKFDIDNPVNVDISSSRAERRGFLRGKIDTPAGMILCVCLHLSLRERDRSRQLRQVVDQLEKVVEADHPMIIAGDFNDWRRRADTEMARPLGLREAFRAAHGREASTFPSAFPILALDRIYFRGLRLVSAQTLRDPPWTNLSDHAGLTAEFEAAA